MSDHWITVATFNDTVAAAVAKNYLENEGIPSILLDEATVATDWMLSTAIGGIKLQVALPHVERAELLLTLIREGQDERAAEGAVADEHAHAIASAEIAEDLKADQEDKQPINELADKLFRATVFGYIIPPLQVYALFLMLQIAGSEGRVSPNRRWKLWFSGVLNVPILAIVVVLVLIAHSWLAGSPGTPDQPNWQRHAFPSLRFSARFPHEPIQRDGRFDGFAVHDYSAQARHRYYLIRIIQNFTRDRPALQKADLEKMIAERAEKNRLEVNKITDVTHKNIAGLEYRLIHPQLHERGRIFNRGKDVFFLIVQSGADDLDEAEPQQFLDSLSWR